MKKKPTKKKPVKKYSDKANSIINKLLILFCVVAFIIVIMISYKMGIIRGMTVGMMATQKIHNGTVCQAMMHYSDAFYEADNGDCIITNAKYIDKLECPFGTFITNGTKEMSLIGKILMVPQKVIQYPMIGCW